MRWRLDGKPPGAVAGRRFERGVPGRQRYDALWPGIPLHPPGIGLPALEWAKSNDRRLLQLVMDMRVEAIVPEVRDRA